MPDSTSDHPDFGTMATRLRRYAVQERRTVSGWQTPGAVQMMTMLIELQWLTGVRGNIAEIGLYHGKTFFLLHRGLRADEAILGVDPFDDGDTQYGPGLADTFATHCRRLGADGPECRVVRSRSDRLSAADVLGALGGQVRLFHIDGEHTPAAVIHDFDLAAATLCPDGVMIIDDFMHPMLPDVTEAVLARLNAGTGLVPFAMTELGRPPAVEGGTRADWIFGAPKLFVARAAAASRYREMLRTHLSHGFAASVRLAGAETHIYCFGDGFVFHSLFKPSR